MLPAKYLALALAVVIFLLLLIFAGFFLVPWPWKKKEKVEDEKVEESTVEEVKVKKPVKRYIIRAIAVVLAVALVAVDVVGIQMIQKVEDTFNNLLEDDDEVEEFIIGVYVRADDEAQNLEDVKDYSMGYSLGYDRNNTRNAINLIEEKLDCNLKLEEYPYIIEMVDAVLAGEKDAFILSESYLTILEDQEEYYDIMDKIKCVYECVVTVKTETTEREEDETETETEIDEFVITEDPFILYIAGTDTRGSGLKNVRNDVNILAAVNPKTKQVLLVNTPRDYYVEITVSENGDRDKLTHCGIYGINCSIETLEHLYGEDISYYTYINFKGFKRLIDAVGGVEVYSKKSFYTTEGHHYIKKGTNLLNGEVALAYARDRFSYSDGDSARGRNQMDIVKGLIDKLSKENLLLKYGDILDAMGKYFACDLTQEEISSLVKMQLDDLAEWEVYTYTVTGEGKRRTTYSMPNFKAYVMIPDEGSIEHAKMLMHKVFDGETIEEDDLKYKK